MYQTAVHRGEQKFAPVERVEQLEVSKEEEREIWITNLSSALISMLMSSSKLFLFSKEVRRVAL